MPTAKRYSTIDVSLLPDASPSPEVLLRATTNKTDLGASYETHGPELIHGQVVHHYAEGRLDEDYESHARKSVSDKNPFAAGQPNAKAVCKLVDLATIAMLRYADRLQAALLQCPFVFDDEEDMELTSEGTLLQQAQLELQNCAYVMQEALRRAKPQEAKAKKPKPLDSGGVLLAGLRTELSRISQLSAKLTKLEVDLTGLSEAIGWAERKLSDLAGRIDAAATQIQQDAEKGRLQQVFGRLDVNNDGVLQPEEFQAFCEAIMATDLFRAADLDFDKLFKQADTDRSGAVDVEEFCAWVFGYLPTAKKRNTVIKHLDDEAALVKAAQEAAEDARRVTRIFKKLDADSSGALEREEFRHFLALLADADASGRSMRLDVDAVMAAMDTDGDGKIDLDEFRELIVRLMPNPQRRQRAFDHLDRRANEAARQAQVRQAAFEHLKHVFARLDADGNGTLDAGEFRAFLTLCTQAAFFTDLEVDVDQVLAQADTDGNGVVDIEEFCAWVFAQMPADRTLESLKRPSFGLEEGSALPSTAL